MAAPAATGVAPGEFGDVGFAERPTGVAWGAEDVGADVTRVVG
ncbi:MAG TPA: hypothetical protein VGY51_03480 [Acidimicrobiales bacterium]|nr:hypothetical protein [Acidimicrobiales bacterium]